MPRNGPSKRGTKPSIARRLARERSTDHTAARADMDSAIEHARKTGEMPAAALAKETKALFPMSGGIEAILHGMELLATLDDCQGARRRLIAALHAPLELADIDRVFRQVGTLVPAGSRGAIWEQLLERLTGSAPIPGLHLPMTYKGARARSGAIALELKLLLALERFSEFQRLYDASAHLAQVRALKLLRHLRHRLGLPRSRVYAEPKVFGIGLTRTGTTSLTAALCKLGIDAVHWTNPFTHQVLSDLDAYLFGGLTDISIARTFESLYFRYPNARFIWTRRPRDSWVESVSRHYGIAHRAPTLAALRLKCDRRDMRGGFANVDLTFELYLRQNSFAAADVAFAERVRNFFHDKPAGKLLEFDVFSGDGWRKLCDFLDVTRPLTPFPFLHSRNDPGG